MPSTLSGRELIKNYLKENHLKISDLAKMYGMTRQDVTNILNGQKGNPASNKFVIKVIHDLRI